jgi:proline iminopeptidase
MIIHSHSMEPPTSSVPSTLEIARRLWGHPGTRITAAAGAAVTSGFIAAVIMPRGPVTSTEALLLMGLGLLTGIAGGFILRSRWASLLCPIVYLAAFEVARMGETGATVDSINLETTYGILALVIGRGVSGALSVLPMLLGITWGRILARRLQDDPPDVTLRRHPVRHRVGVGINALATVALAALAVWIAMPASVPPVVDADGTDIPGSIAEILPLTLGGNEQWIQVRAARPDNPVIVYIPGGPGQSDFAQSRVLLQPLEEDFVVVTWDQAGNGRSYASFNPDAITPEHAVSDLVELTNYLRERFDEEKIYLLGESWGTIPAVLAAQQRPDLFHAVISSGQMVDLAETDRLIYEDLLIWADANDDALARQLRDFGPPPYDDLWPYSVFFQNYPQLEGDYDLPQAYVDRHEASGVGVFGVMGSEYDPINKLNIFRGLMDTFSIMYPQLQDIDFRNDVPALQVPIYLFNGEHELRGRSEPLMAWYARLQAPEKRMFSYEDGGHSVAFEHIDDVHRILQETILPATYPGT